MKIPGTTNVGPSNIFKLDEIIDNARLMMLNTGGLQPVFFMKLSTEEKTRCYPIPEELFNSSEGKDIISATIHKQVEDLKPDSIVFLSEAWVKAFKVEDENIDPSNSEELREEASKCMENINKAGGLASLPRSEKDEVIMISVSDYTKTPTASFTGLVRVLRDRKGVVSNFNAPEWINATASTKASGRFNFG